MKAKMCSIITVILASVLSVLFVISALGAVISGTISGLVQSDSLVKIVQNVDYSKIITENVIETDPETGKDNVMAGNVTINGQSLDDFMNDTNNEIASAVKEELTEHADIVNEIMKSDTVKAIVGTYMDGISASLSGKELPDPLTADTIRSIANDNADELSSIIKDNIKINLSEEQLQDSITAVVDQNAEKIAAAFPPIEQINAEIENSGIHSFKSVFNSTLTILFAVISLVLAGAIFACRYKKWSGLLWLGIVSAITGVFTGVIMLLISCIKWNISGLPEIAGYAVELLIPIAVQKMLPGLILLFAVAVILIVIYIILKKKVINKTISPPVQAVTK